MSYLLELMIKRRRQKALKWYMGSHLFPPILNMGKIEIRIMDSNSVILLGTRDIVNLSWVPVMDGSREGHCLLR